MYAPAQTNAIGEPHGVPMSPIVGKPTIICVEETTTGELCRNRITDGDCCPKVHAPRRATFGQRVASGAHAGRGRTPKFAL